MRVASGLIHSIRTCRASTASMRRRDHAPGLVRPQRICIVIESAEAAKVDDLNPHDENPVTCGQIGRIYPRAVPDQPSD
jgi:hypothetical protein